MADQKGAALSGWEGALVRTIVVLLPITAGLGQYLLPLNFGGISIYAYRLLVAVAVPAILLVVRLQLRVGTPGWVFLSAMYFWLAWGCLAVTWSPDAAAGMAEVVTVAFGLCAVVVLIVAPSARAQVIDDLRRGWVLAYLATAVVAIWELRSGRHLPGSWVDTAPAYAQRGVVLSTFGNPNNYAAFIVLAFPFLSWSVGVSRGFARVGYLLLAASTPIMLVLSGGRLAMLALVVEMGVVLLTRGKGIRSLVLLAGAGVLLVVVTSVALHLDPRTLDKILRVRAELQGGGSASIRLNLAKNGLIFLRDSYGFGAGPASFEKRMATGDALFPTERIVNPHNFWVEIVSQYGVLVFGAFCFALAFSALTIWRANSSAMLSPNQVWGRAATLAALSGYIFAAAENSRFIPQPINWILLGSVIAVSEWIGRTEINAGDASYLPASVAPVADSVIDSAQPR